MGGFGISLNFLKFFCGKFRAGAFFFKVLAIVADDGGPRPWSKSGQIDHDL